jgi:murein DD-endopeptidase MepM/ murein hydrolase activator NlpD
MQHVFVSTGAAVSINDQIGTTGKSGNASALSSVEDEHLHLEIRTSPSPGFGLAGRLDPFKLYGICPLNAPIAG